MAVEVSVGEVVRVRREFNTISLDKERVVVSGKLPQQVAHFTHKCYLS